jgi:tRNA threonylcarbamoyladenosine biosynthesis protein TsaE
VTSPTYQIARRYAGAAGGRAIIVNHLDLYRLEALEDRDALELDDYLDPEAITFVEWASEDALDLIDDPTVVLISHQTLTTRRLSLLGAVARRLAEC